jgi:hypothetical protein
LEKIAEATGKAPPALERRPGIFGLAKEIVEAYNVLAGKRTAGMIPNPIQLSEIVAYVQLYGEPSIPMTIFVQLLTVVDEDDLSHLRSTGGNTASS